MTAPATTAPATTTRPSPPARRGAWLVRGLRRVAAFVIAAAVMVVVGSAAHTYFVQRAWSKAAGQADGTAAPAAIPFADRIDWAAHDLVAMFGGYATLTSVALCIAFLCAGLLARLTGGRPIVFGVAGATAIFVMFKVARIVLGTVGIFGARGTAGLTAQMAVGLIAGLLFAKLTSSGKTA